MSSLKSHVVGLHDPRKEFYCSQAPSHPLFICCQGRSVAELACGWGGAAITACAAHFHSAFLFSAKEALRKDHLSSRGQRCQGLASLRTTPPTPLAASQGPSQRHAASSLLHSGPTSEIPGGRTKQEGARRVSGRGHWVRAQPCPGAGPGLATGNCGWEPCRLCCRPHPLPTVLQVPVPLCQGIWLGCSARGPVPLRGLCSCPVHTSACQLSFQPPSTPSSVSTPRMVVSGLHGMSTEPAPCWDSGQRWKDGLPLGPAAHWNSKAWLPSTQAWLPAEHTAAIPESRGRA